MRAARVSQVTLIATPDVSPIDRSRCEVVEGGIEMNEQLGLLPFTLHSKSASYRVEQHTESTRISRQFSLERQHRSRHSKSPFDKTPSTRLKQELRRLVVTSVSTLEVSTNYPAISADQMSDRSLLPLPSYRNRLCDLS